MSGAIDAIAATVGLSPSLSGTEAGQQPGGVAGAFEKLLEGADRQIHIADTEVQKLAVGKEESLHGVMIAIESAKESLSLVVQIRNRLVEAYQDVLRMQI